MEKKLYRTYSDYLKELFGERVQKVMIDGGFTCPNRDGAKATGGCTFCDEAGSGSPLIQRNVSVADQVRRGIEREQSKKPNTRKFIAYFQAFSNTYAPVETLERLYREALAAHSGIVGLAIGTRPDCVSEAVLDLLSDLQKQTKVWIEYGLQSAHNPTLAYLNRAHTAEEFTDAVERTHARGIPVCAHMILGLPRETPEMMRQTAQLIANLNPHAIKIHSLYLEEGMPITEQFRRGEFTLMSQENYIETACDVLEMLPPEMVVERLTGDPSPEKHVAPEWALKKMEILRGVESELRRRGTRQGSRYSLRSF